MRASSPMLFGVLILGAICGACAQDRSQEKKDPSGSDPTLQALASAVASERARQATPAASVDPAALVTCADELPAKVIRIHKAEPGDPSTNNARAEGAASAARIVRKVVDLKKVSPIDQQLICELARGPDTRKTADAIVALGNRLEGKLF